MYFRRAAAAAFEQSALALQDNSSPFAGIGRSLDRQREAFYNTVAMIQAYFRRLEHTLVLLLPISDYDPSQDSLSTFIGDSWRRKFSRIFNLKDGRAKHFHDRLCEVAEEYRNTYSHGGFDKDDAALHFQIPGIGLVPAALSDIRDKPQFRIVPIETKAFGEVCGLFDEIDRWMRSHAARHGMAWVEGGLDMRFDHDFCDKLRRAMQSEESFDRFMSRHGYVQDRARDMDW